MVTECCRDYSRITGPEKVLKTVKHPSGSHVDAECNLYISHYYGQLKKYDQNFECALEVKMNCSNPWQMACAPTGELLLAFGRRGIHVYNPDTLELIRKIEDVRCQGVAATSEYIYAACTDEKAIKVLRLSDGAEIATHTPGLKSPQGLAVVDDRLLAVADRGNNRVLLLELDTFEVRQTLPPDFAPEHQRLSKPNDVVVDSAGNLLVMDVGHERIAVFREDGTFVTSVMQGFFKNHGNTYPYVVHNPITGAILASNDDEHCVTIFSPIFES
jgi:sugar lactone lactonase YvrE